MRRSVVQQLVAVWFISLGVMIPLHGHAATPGSCVGTANAPLGHCFAFGLNAQLVDMCRCSGGSPTTCGPTGSYYCQNQLGQRIKTSGGNGCLGACTWVTSPEPEPEPVAALLDPVVTEE